MTTLIFTHPSSARHLTPPGHPERPARMQAVEQGLEGLAVARRTSPLAAEAEVRRCHPQRYLDRLRAVVPAEGVAAADPDTWLSPGSLDAALHAIGGVEAAIDAVLAGEVANAFAAHRPPGHHAETEKAMGFCLFGTAAIAAKYALDKHRLARVALIDFDVHHGNGSQDLLWDEDRALFVSSQQMPLYPGTGAVTERGAHGQIVNVPLEPGTDGAEMRARYEAEVFPVVQDFRPELILISAGFDAHRDDPLANLNWTEDDFAWLTGRTCDLADRVCAGRVVSTLEGGYDLGALAASVAAHVGVLQDRGR